MKKEKKKFLSGVVLDFTEWVVQQEANKRKWLSHSYSVSGPRWFNPACCENGKLRFTNLEDAKEKYYWNNIGIAETKELLEKHKLDLRSALDHGDNKKAWEVIKDMLEWGGGKSYFRRMESDTVNRDITSLLNRFRSETNLDKMFNYKINSWYTKVYSLVVDDFIIYDGRVGAALGHLVARFYSEEEVDPDERLQFSWGKGRGKQNRNPSTKKHKFYAMRNDKKRMLDNLRATWLLSEISNRIGKKSISVTDLQSALFMIGYQV